MFYSMNLDGVAVGGWRGMLLCAELVEYDDIKYMQYNMEYNR